MPALAASGPLGPGRGIRASSRRGHPFVATLSQRVIAAVMALGLRCVLISAVAFELMDEAFARGGFDSTAIGFIAGAALYTAANSICHGVERGTGRDRDFIYEQKQQDASEGSGAALAVGALLDGIRESMSSGSACSAVRMSASSQSLRFFFPIFPKVWPAQPGCERRAARARYIFGVWGGIAVISGLAALLQCGLRQTPSPDVIAATTALAAGATWQCCPIR